MPLALLLLGTLSDPAEAFDDECFFLTDAFLVENAMLRCVRLLSSLPLLPRLPSCLILWALSRAETGEAMARDFGVVAITALLPRPKLLLLRIDAGCCSDDVRAAAAADGDGATAIRVSVPLAGGVVVMIDRGES